ncbi:MAG: acyl-CoA/acyl-ACP dehydrogenase [Alphaproteobacteria bacterium]|nr:acyl-CoA/acyl-ACP dehydrogenase [Alphaproteobacteria bacterium]
MRFDFTEDQESLRGEARRFLASHCGRETVRAVLDSDEPYSRELWAEMGRLGWTGVALPEAFGGSGAGYLELCVLAEEMGRVLAPTPFSSSIYLAAELILREGDDAQTTDWLPRLAAGTAIGTLALAEGPGAADWGLARTRATPLGGGHYALTGVKQPVPDGLAADVAIVSARLSGELGLFLVDLHQPEVTRHPEPGLDESRPLGRLSFSGARCARLGSAGRAALDAALDRAAVLFAFEQIGGAEAALSMAVGHARQRFAFGRAIGSFQAIKHKLADMYAELELARSNAYFAAWALASGDAVLGEAAACARLSASRAYFDCAKECVQVHGGMGFTWEADPHLHYRRATLLNAVIGGQARWREVLVSRLQQKDASAREGTP